MAFLPWVANIPGEQGTLDITFFTKCRDLFTMARLYVGNLDARVTAGELEDEFRVFGVLRRSGSV